MIIDDHEAFKTWLSAVLEPLCDADPIALAKYVFALVKKDKPPAELRAIMIEQLDVFLQQETKNFVDRLFKTLETQAYIVPGQSTVAQQGVVQDASVSLQSHQPLPQAPPVQEPQPVVNHQVPIAQTNGIPGGSLQRREADSSSRPAHRKSESDKEEKTRRRHRSSASPPPSRGGRSRSRSWERSRRSRSRGRERDRSRAWRNKSPPVGGSRSRRRTWSRSPPPSSSGPRSRGASRSRSRSPRYNHRSARSYRNRSPPPHSSLSRSRSRSNDRSARDKKEPLSGAATPTQDSNHGDVDMRLTTTSQSIQSVVSACSKPPVPGTTAVVPDNSTSGANFLPKRRCRDFDEKGYCMRGDLCPYDHGNDPVVLEDVALSRVLAFGPGAGPHALPQSGTTPAAPEHVAPPPVAPLEAHPPPPHTLHPPSVVRPTHMEYNPDAPSMEPRIMWGRPQFRGGPPGLRGGMVRGSVNRAVAYNPQPQRELISVPVTDEVGLQQQPQQQQQQDYQALQYGKRSSSKAEQTNTQLREMPAKKKPAFDFNRLGPRHKNPNNCSLELKKVPRALNNITHLNNHFSKFGKIVNIQVSYEGDPEAAIVTFSSHSEAYAAYRSTEAVLNNRFIKVFWHNSGASNNEGKQENVPPPQPPRPSVKDRLGVPSNPPVPTSATAVKVLNTLQLKQEPIEKVIMSGNNLTKTVYIPTALKSSAAPSPPTPAIIQENRVTVSRHKAAAAIKKSQEMLAVKEILKKKQEEKRKEAIKLTADLRKRKQDLLEKQLAEQKSLIERLEKGVVPEQREALMITIKKLQETIEQIRKDLSTAVAPSSKTTAGITTTSAVPLTKKTIQEAQREILDAELDLFTRQQEGGDTAELQRRVAELKMAAHSMGLLRPVTRGGRTTVSLPHRGSLRGRGRGFAHVSVDHRPTKLLVSGYEDDEKAEVISHFTQFGEIVDYVVDDSTPSLILNYKSRKEAEVAMLKGRTFQDRLLSVTWCGGGQPASRSLRSGSITGSLMSTVHLHPGGGAHRQVVLVGGSGADGSVEEPLPEDDDEVIGELSEDVLLQDDEEEEEDGEDRSWRR